jgi:hypothetical protein
MRTALVTFFPAKATGPTTLLGAKWTAHWDRGKISLTGRIIIGLTPYCIERVVDLMDELKTHPLDVVDLEFQLEAHLFLLRV